jgi:hypothetical protein
MRRSSIGSDVSALPAPTTNAPSARTAAPAPNRAEDQLRVYPTAITIVKASTASTAQARNTDTMRPSSAPLMP